MVGLIAAMNPLAVHAQERDRAAVVNGTAIMSADIDSKLGNNLAQLQQQIFALRQKQLETMIDQKLLEDESAKKGVTTAALMQAEISAKVTEATSEDAARFFKENSSRLQGDLKTLEDQIKSYLTAQRMQARQQDYLKSLRAAAKISVFLTPPPVFRSEVSVEGAPVRGNVNAPVTIVEFTDFHCPFCRKVQPVLDELTKRYGSKIRLVFRDFPLDSLHPHARAAAEASRCAVEQGKFWEFHDKMLKSEPEPTDAGLNGVIKDIGMNVAEYEACKASGKYKNSVLASTQEGARLGITGTPTFFVNGRIVVGAQPVEEFIRIIDEELAALAPAPRQSAEARK